MIIDGHTFLGKSIYLSQTSNELLKKMDKHKIDFSVVTAPAPGPFYDDANSFVKKEVMKNKDRLIALYRTNPCVKGTVEKLRSNLDNGVFKGIKLDPTNDGYGVGNFLDDILVVAEDFNVPVYIHSGDSIFCPPESVAEYAKKHPKISFITPRSRRAPQAAEHVNNLYLMSRPFPAVTFQRGNLDYFEIDKLIFISDSPIGNHKVELVAVEQAGLEDKVYQKIMSENIKQIFDIT